jgi:hypothetical protein
VAKQQKDFDSCERRSIEGEPMDSKVYPGENADILLFMKAGKNKCPGGTVFFAKRICECICIARRLERMAKRRVSA